MGRQNEVDTPININSRDKVTDRSTDGHTNMVGELNDDSDELILNA